MHEKGDLTMKVGRPGVDKERLLAAIQELDQEGRLTGRAVRERLGGGSLATIFDAIRDYQARKLSDKPEEVRRQAEIPESMRRKMESFLSEVWQESCQEIEERSKAMKAEVERIAASAHEREMKHQEDMQLLAEEVNRLELLVQALESSLEEKVKEVERLTGQLVEAERIAKNEKERNANEVVAALRDFVSELLTKNSENKEPKKQKQIQEKIKGKPEREAEAEAV